MSSPFSSPDKVRLREDDLKQVIELSNRLQRKLTYLGLPSPWMGDIAVWKDYLSQVCAVEMEAKYIPDLVDTAFNLSITSKQLNYYLGDIDMLLTGEPDAYGRKLSEAFPVDLINLDYCGGLFYEGFQRISALENVFRLQNQALSWQYPIFVEC